MDGEITLRCVNRPLRGRELATVASFRAPLARNLFRTGRVRPVLLSSGQRDLLTPTEAYTTAFLRTPDIAIERAVAALLVSERRAILAGRRLDLSADERARLPPDARQAHNYDPPGYIYVFRNSVDPDTRHMKIGRTARAVRTRLTEWELELEPQEGAQIQELFAVPTRYNKFTERVVHTVLTCERIGGVRNRRTGAELREFFTIDSLMALKLFIAHAVAYCDAFGAKERSRLNVR